MESSGTDAARHHHHGTVIRWVEAAENELHMDLGLTEAVRPHATGAPPSRLPRAPLVPGPVVTDLRVVAVGRSPHTYEFEVCGEGATARAGPAARGDAQHVTGA